MSLVRLNVSAELLLRMLLRLPEGVTLEGASVEGAALGAPSLSLVVDIPGGPDDASRVDLTYVRLPGTDPVQLAGIRWLKADGSEITPEQTGRTS